VSAVAAILVSGGVARAGVADDAVLPDFSAATFVPGEPIDNPYFPLVPNTRYYSGIEFDADEPGSEGEPVEIEITVTNRTKVIDGVTTREVRELEFLGGLLVEDTTDFFAQDTAGNVWYFEEQTVDIEYDDNGNEIGRDPGGSWRHGVNGAQATFIMPADPEPGFKHFSEFAPNDEVLDVSEILSDSESITVPLGSFNNVVKVNVIDVPEPEEFEHKYYAPGVGRIRVEADFNDAGVPLNSISLDSVSVIPLPPTVFPALGLFAAISGFKLRHRHRSRARA